MARTRSDAVMQNAEQALVKVAPELLDKPITDGGIGPNNYALIERSALGPIIARKDVLGFSKAAIARRLGLSVDQVERYAKTPGYLALKAEAYDLILNALDAQIGVFLRDLTVENYRELHKMALNKRTKDETRAKIRMYLLDKADEYLSRTKGGKGDKITEIYEAIKREDAEGNVTRSFKRTVERPAVEGGSSEEVTVDSGAGTPCRENGTEETPPGV